MHVRPVAAADRLSVKTAVPRMASLCTAKSDACLKRYFLAVHAMFNYNKRSSHKAAHWGWG